MSNSESRPEKPVGMTMAILLLCFLSANYAWSADGERGATLDFFPVKSLAFAPSGNFIAVAGGTRPGKLVIWDVEKHKVYKELEGHSKQVARVTFSADGKILASASYDKSVRIWEVATGKQIGDLQGFTGSPLVRFSPDDKTIATTAMSKDGYTIENEIEFWDIPRLNHLRSLPGHDTLIRSFAISPNRNQLASCDADGKIKVWNLVTSTEEQSFATKSDAYCVAFSPNGRTIGSAHEDGRILHWDLSTGKCVGTLKGHSVSAWWIEFSKDGAWLASAGSIQTKDGDIVGEVKLWKVDGYKLIRSFRSHSLPSLCVTFSPNGKMLASGSMDGKVKLWDISSIVAKRP